MPTPTFFALPAAKRCRVLEAAWAEFTAFPYEEASINRIVRQAAIPRGSFYQYFADKADLFAWLLSCSAARTRRRLRREASQAARFRRLFSAPTVLTRPEYRCLRLLRCNPYLDWLSLFPLARPQDRPDPRDVLFFTACKQALLHPETVPALENALALWEQDPLPPPACALPFPPSLSPEIPSQPRPAAGTPL